MADRLSPLDVSFLYMETPTTAMHVGGVAVLEPPKGGFDYDRLVELISQRIALVPRYRAAGARHPRPAGEPGVGRRRGTSTSRTTSGRSALPKPGTDAQLRELVGRLQSRPARPQPARCGDLPRRGLEGGRGRDHHQDPPRDVDGVSPPSTSAP
jgi:hypothetical protein